MLRRYDLVLEFEAPTADQIKRIIANNLKPMSSAKLGWTKIVKAAEGLSQSEIVRATDDVVKTAILNEKKSIATDDVLQRLNQRRGMREAFLDERRAK